VEGIPFVKWDQIQGKQIGGNKMDHLDVCNWHIQKRELKRSAGQVIFAFTFSKVAKNKLVFV